MCSGKRTPERRSGSGCPRTPGGGARIAAAARRWSLGIALLLWTVGANAAAPVRIVGSDLLGLEFTQAFYGFAGRQGIRLALAFDGTKAGLAELLGGRASAALLVAGPEVRWPAAEHDVLRLGSFAVFVWAGSECPLETISFEQLATVFGVGAGHGPAVVRWRDLGRTGAGSDAAITALAPETGAGMTTEFFRHAVLGGGALRKSVERVATTAGIARELVRSPAGVALAGVAPSGGAGVRVLPVSAGQGKPAVAPTAEAVRAGRYALQVPLDLVVRRDAAADARTLLRFVWAAEATALLEQAEVIPVPPDERRRNEAALAPN